MDLRRFLLFVNPLIGVILLVVAVLLFFNGSEVYGIVLVVVGGTAIVLSRRVLGQHEGTIRSALAVLDPEGNSTEEPAERVRRVAALHAEEIKRVKQEVADVKKSVKDLEGAHKKEKKKWAEELKAVNRWAERLQNWLDITPGALIRLDSTGTIRWLNPGGEEMLPGSIGKPIGRFVSDWKPGRFGEFTLKIGQTECPVILESTALELIQGDSSFLLIRDLSGEHAKAVARDAAERARDALRNVVASIAPQTTPEDTVGEFAPKVFQLVSAENVALAIPGDDESGGLVLYSATVNEAGVSRSIPPEASRLHRLFETGEETILLDLEAEREGEEDESLIAAGIRTVGLFPLIHQKEVIAGLRVGFRREAEMSPGSIATLHQLLPAVTRALQGTLRFQNLTRKLKRWKRYIDYLPDPVILCTPSGQVRYRNRQAAGLTPALADPDAMIDCITLPSERDGLREHLVTGYEKGRSRFDVPLVSQGEGRSGEVNLIRLDLGEERLLLLVLRDVSKRKAEAEEVHRREEEAEELYQLALDLGRSLDLQWVMEQIFTKALEVTQLDFGWATLIEHETGSRDLASCYRIELDVVRKLYDEQGHVGFEDRVLRTKKPVVLESMSEDPTISSEAAIQSGVRSLISVPLLLEGEVVGVLNLASSRSYQFKVQDIENLGTFGRIFARGVSNSKRYYEARRRAENYKVMIGEQHAKLKAIGEEIGETQARLQLYRDLLLALWGEGGGLDTMIHTAPSPAEEGSSAEGSHWSLATSVGTALTLFFSAAPGDPSPTDLDRFAFALKEDDYKSHGGAEHPGQENQWEILDALPRVLMVPADVRQCMKVVLTGFRPVTYGPYSIVVKPSPAGAAIEITMQAREHFGSTQQLQAAMSTLRELPFGRPRLAVILLHLVNRILASRGAQVRIFRGEGDQITLYMEFPRVTESGHDG